MEGHVEAADLRQSGSMIGHGANKGDASRPM